MSAIPLPFIVFVFLMTITCVGLAVQSRQLRRMEENSFAELDERLREIHERLERDNDDAWERGIIDGLRQSELIIKKEIADRKARYFGPDSLER